jgi:signal transduction histidine kinase/DNA-binding response OmpR family regulator
MKNISTSTFFALFITITLPALAQHELATELKTIDSLNKKLAGAAQNAPLRVDILNHLSYKYQGVNYQKALEYGEKAESLAKEINYDKGLAVAYNRIANSQWMMGRSELAISKAMESSIIAEKPGWMNIITESYRLLCASYSDVDKAKAKVYGLKAEQLAKENNDLRMLTKVYADMGLIYSRSNKFDTALLYYEKAQILAHEIHFDFYIPYLLAQETSTHSRLGDLPASELKARYLKAIEIAEYQDNRFALTLAYLHFGDWHQNQKQWEEAEKFYVKSTALANEMKLRRLLTFNYFSMISLKIEQGDFWAAHGFMKQYYDLKQEMMNEVKARQIIEMEARFQAEKKEAQIALLEQDKKIQTIWTYVWIAGSAFILLAAAIIYRLQVQKSRKAQELLVSQRELNSRLKEADQLKSRFFANLSHEFRTPLSLILAPLEENIRNSKPGKADMESMLLMRRNAHRLLDMVNELLDLSKLEAKKMRLSVQKGNLKEFLTVLSSSFESLADHKNISIHSYIDIPAQEYWYDSDKVEKVVNNLLSNAFKFTPAHGAVSITATVSTDNKTAFITVTDTGPGIPKEDQKYLFSPFFQSSSTRETDGPGTGLGLALVKELVELHKGSISMESIEKVGTTFLITLPVSRGVFSENDIAVETEVSPAAVQQSVVAAESKVRDEVEGVSTQQLLIIEDNADLLAFIRSVFKDQYTILTAANGRIGYQIAIERMPDLIISDVMMPEMDGIAFLQKVREDERVNHIPVILLTARNELETKLQGLRSGADDYIAKPFSTEELRTRVDNLIEQRKLLAVKYRERFITAATPVSVASADDKFIQKVVKSIEDHLGDPLFSVEKLASEVNLSRAQLFRKLKALMSLSPNQLINDIRLQRAKELILSKADTLSQICYQVGFNEPSYFARRFRQKYGVTPSEYAENRQHN